MEAALEICDHEMQTHVILIQEFSNSEFLSGPMTLRDLNFTFKPASLKFYAVWQLSIFYSNLKL